MGAQVRLPGRLWPFIMVKSTIVSDRQLGSGLCELKRRLELAWADLGQRLGGVVAEHLSSRSEERRAGKGLGEAIGRVRG